MAIPAATPFACHQKAARMATLGSELLWLTLRWVTDCDVVGRAKGHLYVQPLPTPSSHLVPQLCFPSMEVHGTCNGTQWGREVISHWDMGVKPWPARTGHPAHVFVVH